LTARHLLEGTTVLAGAAMIAAGAQALPVYEICKVGEDPRWIPPAVNDGVRAYAVEVKFQEKKRGMRISRNPLFSLGSGARI